MMNQTDIEDMKVALRLTCPSVMLGPGFAIHAHQRASIVGYLALAERCGLRDEAVGHLRSAMRAALNWETLTQAKWRTSVSRRPQRTRHHDSWQIREKYARGGGNDRDYAAYALRVRSEVAA